jgi:hypothetical protein
MAPSSSTTAPEGPLSDLFDAHESHGKNVPTMIISNAFQGSHDFTMNNTSCYEVHAGGVCMCFVMINFADKM